MRAAPGRPCRALGETAGRNWHNPRSWTAAIRTLSRVAPRSACRTESAMSPGPPRRCISESYLWPSMRAEVIAVTEHRPEALTRLDVFVGEWVVQALTYRRAV